MNYWFQKHVSPTLDATKDLLLLKISEWWCGYPLGYGIWWVAAQPGASVGPQTGRGETATM